MEYLAGYIEGGLTMLPHDENCELRRKRSISVGDNPVNTMSLFPNVGRIFSWVTGSLSVDAGQYINENFNNIKRLTKVSVNFAQMFNRTLSIEKKHNEQLQELHKQVRLINQKLNSEIMELEKKMAYQEFLEGLMLTVLDLQRTVDAIFQQTDLVEINQIGPLSRDPMFLRGPSRGNQFLIGKLLY